MPSPPPPGSEVGARGRKSVRAEVGRRVRVRVKVRPRVDVRAGATARAGVRAVARVRVWAGGGVTSISSRCSSVAKPSRRA